MPKANSNFTTFSTSSIIQKV